MRLSDYAKEDMLESICREPYSKIETCNEFNSLNRIKINIDMHGDKETIKGIRNNLDCCVNINGVDGILINSKGERMSTVSNVLNRECGQGETVYINDFEIKLTHD